MKFTSTILIAFATSGADARRLLPATAANVSTVAPINLTESHLTKPVDIKSVTTPSDQDITVEMHELMHEFLAAQSEADCGASNGSCIWKAPAATGAAPATSRYLETATPADLQVALGTYKGDAKKGIGCVFGYCATTIKVNTIATAKAGNKMDVVVKGSGIATVNMDCKDEPYTLDAAGKITLLNYPHTDKSTSKCIAGALPLGVSLKSLTYDAAKHEVDISVGPIGLVVTAKCDDCAAAPAAAPAAAAPVSRKLRGANRRY